MRALAQILALLIVLLSPLQPARALDPAKSIGQYRLIHWTERDGAPSIIYSMPQDRAGFFWATAPGGLYRFDGLKFEHILVPIPARMMQRLQIITILKDGSVAAFVQDAPSLVIYKNGAFREIPVPIRGLVTTVMEASDGAIWVGSGQRNVPLVRFKGGQWTSYGPEAGTGRGELRRLITARDGAIWASYDDGVMRLAIGDTRFRPVKSVIGTNSGVLSLDGDGRIWMWAGTAIYPLSDAQGRPLPRPFSAPISVALPSDRIPTMLFDKDGNAWLSTGRPAGIIRVSPRHTGSKSGDPADTPLVETFHRKDGLASDVITGMAESRDGSIWVLTSRGADQLRDVPIVADPSLNSPARLGDHLLGMPDGDMYVAQVDNLYRVRPGGRPERILGGYGDPDALCAGPNGDVVLLAEKSSWHSVGGTWHELPRGSSGGETPSCAIDRAGTLWTIVDEKGLFRFDGHGWRAVPGVDAADALNRRALVADAHGTIFVMDSAQSVARWDGNRLRPVIKQDSPAGRLMGLYRTKRGVIASGSYAIADLSGPQPRYLHYEDVPPLREPTASSRLRAAKPGRSASPDSRGSAPANWNGHSPIRISGRGQPCSTIGTGSSNASRPKATTRSPVAATGGSGWPPMRAR